ncbi:MAG: MFS transporter [Chloroflexi bacterium]|nr:MFS transporter [Chloroflexota bacterium]
MLWLSDSFVGCAEQVEFLVLAWYILQETDSPLLLGVYGALRFTGTLLSPIYGVMVDRYDRRKLILLTRTVFFANSGVLLTLALTDVLMVWHVFVLAGVAGMGRAFDTIVRQTVIPDIVPASGLMNGVALTRTGRDIMQIVGPLIGGYLLTAWGIGITYIAVIGLYAVGVALAFKLKSLMAVETARGPSVVANIREALGYVRRQEVILALLLLAFLVNLTGFPLNQGLMPVFARDVLDVGATGLGQLLGAYAAGSMLASVTLAALPVIHRPGRMIVLGAVGWHFAMMFVAFSQWFGPSLILLALTGVSQSVAMVTMSMTILSATSPEVRGRVMGLRSLAVYGLPIGLLLSGALADGSSVKVALIVNASVGIIFAVVIAVSLSELWRHHR